MAGWNVSTWGLGTWGLLGDINVSVTGQALSASLGNETTKTDVAPIPTGFPLTTATTTPTILIAVEPPITGIAMTANLGTADAGPDAMLTGNAMSMSLGTVDAFNTTGWGRLQWGINSWGRPGIDISTSVTGIAMTAAAGTLAATGDRQSNTSELQSRLHLVCRLLLEKKKTHERYYEHLHTNNSYSYKRALSQRK